MVFQPCPHSPLLQTHSLNLLSPMHHAPALGPLNVTTGPCIRFFLTSVGWEWDCVEMDGHRIMYYHETCPATQNALGSTISQDTL
jgi:hypothetical protein